MSFEKDGKLLSNRVKENIQLGLLALFVGILFGLAITGW